MAAITSLQTDSWQVALIIAAHNAAVAEGALVNGAGARPDYAETFARMYQAMYAGLQGRRIAAAGAEDDRDLPVFGPRATQQSSETR